MSSCRSEKEEGVLSKGVFDKDIVNIDCLQSPLHRIIVLVKYNLMR